MADAVRLTELVAACNRRGAPLAAETGLFIALQSVEAVRSAPAAVNTDTVQVTLEGTVEVQGAPPATESGAVLGVASVLEAAVSPLPGGARDVLRRARNGELSSLGDLHAEIEALLVPLNRGAARRVLGRLVRDQQKERERLSVEGAGDEVDAGALLAREGRAKADPDALGSAASEEAVPPLPPPPRLGSLASLQATLPSALDTEPDASVPGATTSAIDTEPGAGTKKASPSRRAKALGGGATDTIPDQPSAVGDEGDDEGDDEGASLSSEARKEGRTTQTPGRSGWLSSVMMWLIGLLVGGALLFFVLRLMGR